MPTTRTLFALKTALVLNTSKFSICDAPFARQPSLGEDISRFIYRVGFELEMMAHSPGIQRGQNNGEARCGEAGDRNTGALSYGQHIGADLLVRQKTTDAV